MKNFILLSVLALGAMTMNAELNLQFVGSIKDTNYIAIPEIYCMENGFPASEYVTTKEFSGSNTIYHIYSFKTCTKVKDVSISNPSVSCLYMQPNCFSDDFWTDDGKICFLVCDSECDGVFRLYNEDGQMLKEFSGVLYFIPADDAYYVIDKVYKSGMDVYKIPYSPTEIEAPTAPARTSNARKVIENGQMYIILDGVKYAVTGSTTL